MSKLIKITGRDFFKVPSGRILVTDPGFQDTILSEQEVERLEDLSQRITNRDPFLYFAHGLFHHSEIKSLNSGITSMRKTVIVAPPGSSVHYTMPEMTAEDFLADAVLKESDGLSIMLKDESKLLSNTAFTIEPYDNSIRSLLIGDQEVYQGNEYQVVEVQPGKYYAGIDPKTRTIRIRRMS